MAVGLRNYPEHERLGVVSRRLYGGTKGLGFLAAQDYKQAKKRSEAKQAQPK